MEFRLVINCDGDIFGDGHQSPDMAAEEVARLLRQAADRVLEGADNGPLVTRRGQPAGEFRFARLKPPCREN